MDEVRIVSRSEYELYAKSIINDLVVRNTIKTVEAKKAFLSVVMKAFDDGIRLSSGSLRVVPIRRK